MLRETTIRSHRSAADLPTELWRPFPCVTSHRTLHTAHCTPHTRTSLLPLLPNSSSWESPLVSLGPAQTLLRTGLGALTLEAATFLPPTPREGPRSVRGALRGPRGAPWSLGGYLSVSEDGGRFLFLGPRFSEAWALQLSQATRVQAATVSSVVEGNVLRGVGEFGASRNRPSD